MMTIRMMPRRAPSSPRRRVSASVSSAALAIALLSALACEDPLVPDLNNPSIPISGVIPNPTRAQVQSLVTGVLAASRADHGTHVRDLEIVGRDLYNLDNADPRYTTEMLGTTPFDPSSNFGGAHWLPRYRSVRSSNILLASMATASAPNFTAQQISATNGFVKTFKALDLLYVIETRDTLGMAADAADALTPILCKPSALARVSALLDTARTELLAGGSSFPFSLPLGFQGFNTPATFARFNRAIKARAEAYRSNWAAALTAITDWGFGTTDPLSLGVYHNFSIVTGDLPNPFITGSGTIRVHPSVTADAEAGDRRVANRVGIGQARTSGGLTSNLIVTHYTSPSSPMPIVRNEEMILLRAQANLGLGNLAAATSDINVIRQAAGLLPAAHATVQAATDDLLKQKRYSLLFESGSRWIDARQYGRLATLPKDRPTHNVHHVYPIPSDEALARNNVIQCTT
jgi:hypothetical protein